MKKIIYLIIIMMAAVSSCTSQQPLATTPKGDNPLSFKVEGNTITAELVGNATTGYTWACQIKGNSVKLVSDNYEVPQRDGGPVMLGQAGKHVFELETVCKGKSTVTFDYAQHWSEGKSSGVRKLEISVDGSLAAQAREVEK